MGGIKYVNGQPMVPSGHADGSFIPVAPPYDAAASRAQAAREREGWDREREARFQAALEADRAEDERLAAAQRRREEAQREVAEAAVAEVRQRVEKDLRLGGCPEGQVRGLADEAMRAHHAKRAAEAAELGDRQDRELKDYFRRQGRAAGAID